MPALRDRATALDLANLRLPIEDKQRYVDVLGPPKSKPIHTFDRRDYRQAFHPYPAPTSTVGKVAARLAEAIASRL